MSATKRILDRLAGVRETKSGWSARCPAHDDSTASLSVAEGEGGRVLLKCFAGCSTKAIVAAVNAKERDLFEADSAKPTKTKRSSSTTKASKAYATADAAQEAYQRTLGEPTESYAYLDASGKPVGRVLRWRRPGRKKEIRPISLHADGWRLEQMAEPRPLYMVNCVVQARGSGLVVVEGEKCVHALSLGLGLRATTSAGGSNAASKSDWSPLAGRDVVILPDADAPGRKYAAEVAEILLGLDPPARVRIVDLAPDRDDGFDVADMYEACRSEEELKALRAKIGRLADEAEPLAPLAAAPATIATSTAPTKASKPLYEWRPFPIDALPEPLAGFVREIAAAVDCDPAAAAVPMLPVLAAAIGTTRQVELKPGYEEPAILWSAIVASSGSAKSAPFKLVTTPTRDRDDELRQENGDRRRDHETEIELYETALNAWRKGRTSGRSEEPPPLRPEPPVSRRARVVDATVEALAPSLADNPRGLLLARDELSGWLGGLNRYAQKGGSDEAFYLDACFEGTSHSVDRRTGDRREIYVPIAALSICGTIQPLVLRQHMTLERRASGLLARMLVAAPPGRPSRWSDAEVSVFTRQAYADVIASLYRLTPEIDAYGQERPRLVRLHPAAKKLYTAWHDRVADELGDVFSDELGGAWSKLRKIAGRIALVIHATRAVVDSKVDADVIDVESMKRALSLAEWFRHETRRVYRLLGESQEETEERTGDERLLAWLRRQREPVTARDALSACRWLSTAEEAEAALQRLAAAGRGAWQSKPAGDRGGRPTRLFVLRQADEAEPAGPAGCASAEPPRTPAFSGCASADVVRKPGGVVEL
jgi:hypothetical protein